jgi:D-alanyl-D-alanine endopeptidase (penicillin-binding protein 7)
MHTSFTEPTGLSAMNTSTAREVNTMLREVMSRPQIAAIMGTRRYRMTAVRKDGYTKELELSNTDRLLNSGQVAVVGGKTGYTDLARYCLAISVLSPSEELSMRSKLGIVLMGAEGKLTRFADVRRILDWLRRKAEGVLTTSQ